MGLCRCIPVPGVNLPKKVHLFLSEKVRKLIFDTLRKVTLSRARAYMGFGLNIRFSQVLLSFFKCLVLSKNVGKSWY